MTEFQVGDRVKYVGSYYESLSGRPGIVSQTGLYGTWPLRVRFGADPIGADPIAAAPDELEFISHAPKSLDDVSNEEWNQAQAKWYSEYAKILQFAHNALSNEEIAQDDDAYQEMLDDAGLSHVVLDVQDEKFKADLQGVLADIEDILIAKNRAYGNSALEPVRIFSKADVAEQLRVRIDDKLSRLMKGTDFADEDTVTDLLGYLILLKIAEGKK